MYRPRLSLYVLVFLSLIAFATAIPTTAQNLGSLAGTVTDPSGASVAGATVTLTDLATNTSRTTKTTPTGTYNFAQVSPGNYRLEVVQTGFKKFAQEPVAILVATPSTVDARLEVGAVTQEVMVESAALPAINTQDATVGNPFDEHQVKSLPFLARNVVNLLTLQPGVIFTGESDTDLLSMGTMTSLDMREGSVDGVRGNQTNVTVDGVDSNDWQNQSPFTSALPVTLDSVEEFRVTTTNANATEGTVGGPEVALVTKSGTDNFHGNLRWYYRTSGTAANQFFDNESGLSRPKLQRQIPGASLGGPIKKDRFFFFLDTEERREASSEPVVPRQVPSDALRDGVLVYQCNTASQCPGGTVQGLTASHNIPAGAFGLTPAEFKSLDPAGLGVNPAMITLLNFYPHGNDPSQGQDAGLSFNALEFNSPIFRNSDIQTARLDYKLTRDGRHSIFWRGTIGDYHVALQDAMFPGDPPSSLLLNNSKGFAVQYQGQLSSTLVDTARYGFTRLGVEETGANGAAFSIRSFDNLYPSTPTEGGNGGAALRDGSHRVPVHDIGDDLTYTRGVHTLQFGASVLLIHNQRIDLAESFPSFLINNGFCVSLCDDMVSAINGGTTFPAVANPNLFERSMMALTGSITQVNATFFADPHTNTLLPSGSPELRDFAERYYEVYAQDSWKVRPNLTFTYGLRWGYETPPWEVNGYQVAPTEPILTWFRQRAEDMNKGIPSSASPLLSWGLAGSAWGKSSWYNPDYRNFAPRIALAYSPNLSSGIGHALFGDTGKTAIRLGSGIFYDRVGQAIAVDSDLNGSPGTSTSLIDGSQTFNLTDAPRFSGTCTSSGICSGLPSLGAYFPVPTKAVFPFSPVANASNLGFVVDQNLRTPYSLHFTASVQRELQKGLVLDVAYVGTMGRRLLGKVDFGQYLDIRDPKSGQDLWGAFRQIAAIANPTPSNPTAAVSPAQATSIKPIPFFQDMLPNMPQFAAAFAAANPTSFDTKLNYASMTPTQAFYAYTVQDTVASWSCALFPLDTFVGPGGFPSPWNKTVDPNGTGFVLFDQQFSSLPGWTNFGNSNYNSLQVSLRKTVGFATFGFNYVYSHSIDNDSGTENGDLNNAGNGTLNALIQNPFDLRAGRSSSDFDLRHDFNANWVITLPFGRGQKFASGASRLENLLIGGWEISGLARWRTGFPQTPANGFNFPTNFFLTTPGTIVSPIGTHVVQNGANGLPNLFRNATAALNSIGFTLPGFSGSRNYWTGPAYADFDAGVAKAITMPWSEQQVMRFRVTAFNVFNSVNFADAPSGESLDPTAPNVFGQFVSTAGPRGGAREMEFAVRYEF